MPCQEDSGHCQRMVPKYGQGHPAGKAVTITFPMAAPALHEGYGTAA